MSKRKFPIETFVQSTHNGNIYYIYDYEIGSNYPYKILTLTGGDYAARASDLQSLGSIQHIINSILLSKFGVNSANSLVKLGREIRANKDRYWEPRPVSWDQIRYE